MYAIIDTETSGLFDFSKPAHAEGQPRLASFAAILTNESLDVTDTYHRLIRPDGWDIEPAAAAANKLTLERLNAEGVPVHEVLAEYTRLITAEGRIIVAFNAQFDTKVMRGELRRASMDDLFEITQNICVMWPLLGICRIPTGNGNRIKTPKLTEAMAHFKEPYGGEAHDALTDAAAALTLMRRLRDIGRLPAPKVHYAKKRPEPIEPLPQLPLDQQDIPA